MEHKWELAAPPEDMGVMCNTCFQCKCCGPTTKECKGKPDDEWLNDVVVGGK